MPRADTRFAALLVAAFCGTCSPAAAQESKRIPAGNASIAGRVIDLDTKRPIAGAMLSLLIPSERDAILLAISAIDGTYTFDGIAAGEYRVKASHQDYLEQTAGASAERSTNLALKASAAQRLGDVDFALVRGGSLRGRVVDSTGSPIKDARVVAERAADERPPAAGFRPGSTRADERGDYVIHGLIEGAYLVTVFASMPVEHEAAPGEAPIHFPGTRERDHATVVRVRTGEAVPGIDIRLPPSDLLTLSGHVVRGSVNGNIDAYLLAEGSAVRTLKLDKDGAFSLRVRKGRYRLCATVRNDDFVEAVHTTLDLSADMTDLTLAMTPTATISGRLVTADGSPRPNALFQVLALLSENGKDIDPLRRDRTDVTAEGTFEVRGLFGERALQVVGVPDGWTVHRIQRGKTAVTSLTLAPSVIINDLVIVIGRQ